MKNKKKTIAQIEAYCRKNIEDYEPMCQIALNRIDKMRCPLDMAMPELASEIDGQIEEWAEDNELTAEQIDELMEEIDNEDILFYCQ